MTEKQRRCPICGHFPLTPRYVDRTFEYGTEEDVRITVHAQQVPIEVCESCGESYSGPEAARVEHEAICHALGLPTPAAIVALRDRLRLSQDELAELTGIGKATISRWERGRVLPNRAMARFLALLDYDDNVRRLRRATTPSIDPVILKKIDPNDETVRAKKDAFKLGRAS